jgi:hypothetical protein
MDPAFNSLFSYGVKCGYLERNPASAIDRIKIVDAPPEIFTPNQLQLILEKAPSKLMSLLAIGAFAGLRIAELRPYLREWLEKYPGEILAANWTHELGTIRKKFELSHDVLRHTFISMHIAEFKSFADSALESGNSESIIRNHYLDTSTAHEAKAFWQIFPTENGQDE